MIHTDGPRMSPLKWLHTVGATRIYRGGCVSGCSDQGVKVGQRQVSAGANVTAQQVHSCLPDRSRLILQALRTDELPTDELPC